MYYTQIIAKRQKSVEIYIENPFSCRNQRGVIDIGRMAPGGRRRPLQGVRRQSLCRCILGIILVMGVLGPANKGEPSGRLYVIVYQPLLPLDLHAPCVLGVSDRGSISWLGPG